MKRYMLLASIISVILITSGCTNKNINSSSSISNKTNKTNTVQAKPTSNNTDLKEEKALEASYKENNDIKKNDIEEARNFQTSLKNGSVIMISRGSSKEVEVYNISSLDKFVDSFNNGKEGYVRVIKGAVENDGLFAVNKLEEYETDGKVIKATPYDTYTDKSKFTLGKPTYLYKIIKSCQGNLVRYSVLQSKDTKEDMGATVISFDKNSIKN